MPILKGLSQEPLLSQRRAWGKKFPSTQTRKLRPESKWKNGVAHHLGRTELGPNSPSHLPPGLRSSQATGYKRCRHNNNPNRCTAYLQSQTHLRHSGFWLRKAPFCGVWNGDLGLTVSELWAGVRSVLAENSKSLWFTWQLNYSKHPVPYPARLAPPTTHSHWVGFFVVFFEFSALISVTIQVKLIFQK